MMAMLRRDIWAQALGRMRGVRALTREPWLSQGISSVGGAVAGVRRPDFRAVCVNGPRVRAGELACPRPGPGPVARLPQAEAEAIGIGEVGTPAAGCLADRGDDGDAVGHQRRD